MKNAKPNPGLANRDFAPQRHRGTEYKTARRRDDRTTGKDDKTTTPHDHRTQVP